MSVLPDIPRTYTALAEWLSCILYISLAPRRISGIKLFGVCGGFLAAQMVFLTVTDGIDGIWWLVCMGAAISMMFLLLWCCCDLTTVNIGFTCVRAFLLAELLASLEWQISCFYAQFTGDSFFPPYSFSALVNLVLIYGLLLTLMWVLEQRFQSGLTYKGHWTELVTAILIGGGSFALSNLSFLNSSTPFSSSNGSDIFYIRTLVDICGVAALFAYHIQHLESYMRYELSATTTILKNQYDQYCMSKETIDLINRKYHDLKNQIAALRIESDPDRRSEWLDEMESDIRQYEAENKTGNAVLDTLLTGKSLYCQKNDISLTCVADGTSLDFMKVMDLCSIFGNALDNAIESTIQLEDREKRLIHVVVCRQKRFIVIRIENYFGGTLEFEEGIPVTTKTDRAYHGFGVRSIRSSVENYGGTLSISTERGWFELKILIPIPA